MAGKEDEIFPALLDVAAADELAVDEHLGVGGRVCDGAQRAVRVVAVQHQLLELDAGVAQQTLRLCAERAAGARKNGDVMRLLGVRREVFEHRVRVRNVERIARLLRLDEHLLHHAVGRVDRRFDAGKTVTGQGLAGDGADAEEGGPAQEVREFLEENGNDSINYKMNLSWTSSTSAACTARMYCSLLWVRRSHSPGGFFISSERSPSETPYFFAASIK